KTCEVLPPLTAMVVGPGPAMVRFLVTDSTPLVSAMVPVRPSWKSTRPLTGVATRASRREPGPESLRFVTVLGSQRSSRASRCGRQSFGGRLGRRDDGTTGRRKNRCDQRMRDTSLKLVDLARRCHARWGWEGHSPGLFSRDFTPLRHTP